MPFDFATLLKPSDESQETHIDPEDLAELEDLELSAEQVVFLRQAAEKVHASTPLIRPPRRQQADEED